MQDRSVGANQDYKKDTGETPAHIKRADDQAEGLPRTIPHFPLRARTMFISAIVVTFTIILALILWHRGKATESAVNEKKETEVEANEIALKPEAIAAAGIRIEEVTQQPATMSLRVTGTVEANQQQTQQVTPLVTGRVERVNLALGDRVRTGEVLAVISSPEIAEKHGKLHEAETHMALAERNLERVLQPENRVAVLSAKAKLDESEAALRRTRRLIELGAGAGKDLIAAESAYKTAKAEYDFQSNISLSREVQQAKAEVETAGVEVAHLKNELRVLGALIPEEENHNRRHDISIVELRAPISGTVIERGVNAGAGIEAGKPIFTIANISTVWVIANVPEAQVGLLRVGTPAEVRSIALGQNVLAGRVAYIDPRLNEETRTARVRIEATNQGEKLKVGMFVEVSFQTGAVSTGATTGHELVVPSEAVQRIGDRAVVFMPKGDEPGHFEVREVELGGESGEYHKVIRGLAAGDRVVTKGSFTLKTQLMKGQLGEE